MYRTIWGLVAAFGGGLAIALLIFGASSARNDAPADFTFVNGTEPKSLDPNIMTGQPEGRIGDAIFEGLTYRDPKTLQPTPGMAKSWDITPDGRLYTFHLRKDALWSDGTPLTAHDFAWSWRRLQDPNLGSEYPYIQHMIRYAEEYNTYGGQVSRLLGSVAEKLIELIQKKPGGVGKEAWADFAKANGLSDLDWLPVAELPAGDHVSAAQLKDLVRAAARAAKEQAPVFVAAEELDEKAMARVLGKTSRALVKLIRATDGVDVAARDVEGLSEKEAAAKAKLTWQHFVKSQHANDTLKGTPDAKLRAALVLNDGRLSKAELDALLGSLLSEAARRADVWAEAHEKYGHSGGVYAKDDHTLIVELRALTPYFLEITSFYSSFPVPRHVVEKKDAQGNYIPGEYVKDWFTPRKIVSNGPFVLSEWRVNEKIRLRKSDTYWNKDAIQVDIIDALPIENATTGMNLYLSGAVDWMPVPPPDLAGVLKERPERDYHLRPGMIVYYYRLNCTRKGLDDPRVRRAIAMSIDRKSIVENILKQGQLPAYHVVPPGIPGYEAAPSGLAYDPEAAKKLLAAAGYPGGKGLGTLRLLFNTNESHRAIAEAVTDQLRRNLGLDVNSYNQEWQAYQANMLKLDYDIARAGWIGDYLDPNTFLDMWITNGGNNQTGWSNAMYDDLIRYAADVELLFKEDVSDLIAKLKEPEKVKSYMDAVRSAPDAERRLAASAALRFHLFREAEAIMFQDEVPIIPIYYYVTSSLVHPYVQGWHADLETPDGGKVPNLQDIHPLRGISVDRDLKRRMFP